MWPWVHSPDCYGNCPGASQNVIVEDRKAKVRQRSSQENRQAERPSCLWTNHQAPRQLASHPFGATIRGQSRFSLGTVDQLVSCDSIPWAGIFQNLLGATAILRTLDQANQAARATDLVVRIVTLMIWNPPQADPFAGVPNCQNNSLFIKPELDALLAEQDLVRRLKVEAAKLPAKKENLDKGLADPRKLSRQMEKLPA